MINYSNERKIKIALPERGMTKTTMLIPPYE